MIVGTSQARSLPFFVISAACIAAFFSSFAMSRIVPSVFEIIFGIIPFFVLGTVLVMIVCQRANILRADIEVWITRLVCIAAGISVLASMSGIWNNIGAILLPEKAFFSIVTFGVWPFGEGPLAVIRFLPIIFSVGTFFILKKYGKSESQAMFTALALYIVQSIMMHALSWFVWFEYVYMQDILENMQDAFRIFVSANVNGFWTHSQTERFLAAAGGQTETSMQAVHGAFVYASAVCIALGSWIPWKKMYIMRQELVRMQVVKHAGLLVLGVSIGLSVRMNVMSFSDGIAWILFLCACGGWIAWWELQERGESCASESILLALFCSFLLGWPVTIGFVIADLIRRSLIRGQVWPGVWSTTIGHIFFGFALMWTGVAFGLRDLPSSAWILQIVMAGSIIYAGSWLGGKLLRTALARQWQMGYIFGVAAISVLISAQFVFILPLVLLLIGMALLQRSDTRWETYRVYLLDFFFCSLLLPILLLPALISH